MKKKILAKLGAMPYSATKGAWKSNSETKPKEEKATPSYSKEWKAKDKSEGDKKNTISVASNAP